MTSVNETEFEPADFLMNPESESDDQNRETEKTMDNSEKIGQPGRGQAGTLGGQTGWEGWDDQDEWKERVKVELDEKMKVEESVLPAAVAIPSSLEVPSRSSQEVETDTEGGYETAREGYTTETEGHATETEAFFSADEEINEASDIITQVDINPPSDLHKESEVQPEDPDSTPRNSPLPEQTAQTQNAEQLPEQNAEQNIEQQPEQNLSGMVLK